MSGTDRNIVRALACAAIAPGLESILVFDASPARLRAIQDVLVRLVGLAHGRAAAAVSLGPSTSDDTLWGAYRIARQPVWTPGLLAPDTLTVVAVRDLAALNLEAQRTLVAVVGAEVAHLERHGRSETWPASWYWLAACARSDVGRISPHLLDRFVLRIDAGEAREDLTATQLGALIEGHELGDAQGGPARLGDDIALADLDELRRCILRHTDAAVDRTVAYFPEPVMRRTITLARLASACARLDGERDAVLPRHVDDAAALIGLAPPDAAQPAPSPPPVEPPAPAPPSPPIPHPPPPPEPLATRRGDTAVVPAPQPVVVPDSSAALLAVPYQEDRAEVERDPAPLAFPALQQRATVRATRGAAIGVMRSHGLHDLAVVATLVEAAKHRKIRGALRVTPADLHRYRRAAPVVRMLGLVVDHTALAGWDWGAAVLPYLREAYAARASVCIVQVGAALDSELRARHSVSRSLLSAPLRELFAASAGSATPLAHGLDLALEALRHALQHGRGVAVRAKLVVVTDGRGNVPLEASRRGELAGRVRDEGVRDAIKVAEKLCQLERLEAIVIEPPPTVATELPARLAAAMGAQRRIARLAEVDA